MPSKETCEGVREAGKCGSGGARLHMSAGKHEGTRKWCGLPSGKQAWLLDTAFAHSVIYCCVTSPPPPRPPT